MGGIERDFKFYIQKLIFVEKKQDKPLQDLIFVYTILALLCLSTVFLVIGSFVDITKDAICINCYVIALLLLFYIWSNSVSNIKPIRYLFFILAIFLAVFLWFFTEGSSGVSILLFQAYVTLLVFISIGKEFNIILLMLILTTGLLFVTELIFPELMISYQSKSQKTWDVLSVVILLFLVEIPILIYARNNLYRERNKALKFAESKSFILASMSHEIRTPMNAIIGFTELLADPTIEKDEHDNYLQIINQNSRILMNLLNNVINVSKLESGTAQVYVSSVSANKVMKFVYETLKSLCVNCGGKLDVEYLDEKEANFEVDENLLFQIIVNLGYNAIKFTKKGTITLKVERDDNFMVFSVKDTGCGIPVSQQKDLFKRFRQVNNSGGNMVPSNGAGLGLSICKSLTELLHGEIWFISEENIGSEFFVKFPVNFQADNDAE